MISSEGVEVGGGSDTCRSIGLKVRDVGLEEG